jgi:hypothetical protein
VELTSRDAKFKQAAGTYLVYGVIYWVTALYLQLTVFPARGPLLLWFGLGALLAVGVPWLLWSRRPWFERWALSRRDLTRILAVLVALRALAVARIALGGAESMRMPTMGGGVPMNPAGAWVMALVALVTAAMLARAAWATEERQP